MENREISGGGLVLPPEPAAAPDPTAITLTATFAGYGFAPNTAEIISLTQRFDAATLAAVTDVEIRLRSQAPEPPAETPPEE